MREDRPTFDDVPYTAFERKANAVTLLLNLVGVVALGIGWSWIPPRIPTHFDLTGTVDAWGTRSTLVVLPLVLFAVNVLFAFVQRIPERYNYPVPVTPANARNLYLAGRRFVVVLQLSINVVLWSLVALIALVGGGVLGGLPWWWLLVSFAGLGGLTLRGMLGMKRLAA